MCKRRWDQMARTVTRLSNGKRTWAAGGFGVSVKQAVTAKSSTLSLGFLVAAAGSAGLAAGSAAALAEIMMGAALAEIAEVARFSVSKWIQLDAETSAVWDRPFELRVVGSIPAMSLR